MRNLLVFEVLSERTSCMDRIEKWCECGATPSALYLPKQDAIAAMVFIRKGDDLVPKR